MFSANRSDSTSSTARARGTPCSYCSVPVLHSNQQCCLNCKNHPFDVLESNDNLRLNSTDAPTPPISPTTLDSRTLAFEAKNIYDGTLVRISADDLKEEALWRLWDAGLLFVYEPSEADEDESTHTQELNSITANHAVGIKLNGNAFGKTCLFAGDQFIVDRNDENMAGSVIIYENRSVPFGTRIEYSVSEDSLDYTRVTIKADAKAWYDEEAGHPAAWLFHERSLYDINDENGDEAESDFDFEDEKMHGVVFNVDTEAQYIGPDNLYDDRLLVECEGVEFSIKRAKLVVEVEVNEYAYAQKLRENYSDQEQFWFQFGDKVWVVKDDECDDGRVIVRYEDEEFSVEKIDLDL